ELLDPSLAELGPLAELDPLRADGGPRAEFEPLRPESNPLCLDGLLLFNRCLGINSLLVLFSLDTLVILAKESIERDESEPMDEFDKTRLV
ncbi:MAG: hypothetical protein COY57_05705, partial [Flavobacteriales bacterium CG_4_10_14_0_8_um_filter_32_5]